MFACRSHTMHDYLTQCEPWHMGSEQGRWSDLNSLHCEEVAVGFSKSRMSCAPNTKDLAALAESCFPNTAVYLEHYVFHMLSS